LFLIFALLSCAVSEENYFYKIDFISGVSSKMELSYRTDGYNYITHEIHYNPGDWVSPEYVTSDPWIKFSVDFKTGPGKIKVIIYKNGDQWRYDYLEGTKIEGRLP
jgi:hypothetical protein